LTAYRPPKNWPRPAKFFAQIFLATLASQLALLPVFTNVFYKVSFMGLIANMLLVPLASLLMALTFVYYLASLLHIGLVAYFPCAGGLYVFQMLVEFFASAKFSAVSVTAWNAGTITAYYTLLFLIFNLPNKNFARKIAVPCVAVAALACACGAYVCGKDRVYLLSEWDRRAAIVRANGKTFVFNNRLAQEKIDRAFAALGLPPPTAVFALNADAASGSGVVVPFTEIWPGNEMTFDDVRVQAVWEIHQAKDGHLWSEPGYSGKKGEGISYCVRAKNDTLCIGQQAHFAQRNQTEIIDGETNKTVSAKW
jgi:competence protein ComEC